MIDIEKAKKAFIKYTENYDLKVEAIERKQKHSLRVKELSTKIATELKLSQDEIDLATLIGLLHDIARFEQYTQYKTYRDVDSFDHGDYGVKILNEDIRNYIDTDEYDKIIKCAVKNHNKYKIEEGLSEKESLFCKMIRDADKLDILFEAETMFWKDDIDRVNIEKCTITDEIMEQILNKEPVKRKKGDNELVKLLCIIAFVFDINFKPSLRIIKNKKYIDNILNRFEFKDANTKKQIELIKENVNNYIDERLKK